MEKYIREDPGLKIGWEELWDGYVERRNTLDRLARESRRIDLVPPGN
jgi:hypothetical protein